MTTTKTGACAALRQVLDIHTDASLSDREKTAALRNTQVDMELNRSAWLAEQFRADWEAKKRGGDGSTDIPFVLKLIIGAIPSVGYHLQQDLERLGNLMERTEQEEKIYRMLSPIGVDTLAAHGLICLFNATLSAPMRDGSVKNKLLAIAMEADTLLIAERRCQAILTHPDSEKFRKALEKGTTEAVAWVYRTLNLTETWDYEDVGAYLVNLVLEVTQEWFTLERDNKENFAYTVHATSGLLGKLESSCDNICHWISDRTVMYCPPIPWNEEGWGGFLTSTDSLQTGLSVNQKGRKGCEINGNWTQHLFALNSCQNVPWAINPFIADLQRKLYWQEGGGMAGIPKRNSIPLQDDWSDQKKRNTAAYNKSVLLPQSMMFSRKIDFTASHKDVPKFWYTAGVDARGRVRYLSGDCPNPHGSDLDKGVLQFGHSTALGAKGLYWLEVGIATEVGHDKLPFDERAAWTRKNSKKLQTIVNNPIKNLSKWEDWDNPFRALALAEDYLKAKKSKDPTSYMSQIPVGFDSTNSAIQLIGTMTGDKELMQLSNVLPMDDGSRGDFYLAVGKGMHRILHDESVNWSDRVGPEIKKLRSMCPTDIPRDICKRSMMAVYGSVSVYGQTDGMKLVVSDVWPEYFDDTGNSFITSDGTPEGTKMDWVPINERDECEDDAEEMAKYGRGIINQQTREALARLLLNAMQADFPRLYGYLVWTGQFARFMGNQQMAVEWETPIGMTIKNEYLLTRRETVQVLGSTLSLGRRVVEGRLDSRKMSSALPPNFIHSFDAAYLMKVVEMMVKWGHYEVGTIHDCILVPAGSAQDVHLILRQTFLDMFEGQDFLKSMYQKNLKRLNEDTEDIPAPLSYQLGVELRGVLQSEFFFS